MASRFIVDSHPQKAWIIDQILAGKPMRIIASKLDPKISSMSLQRYKAAIITPALSKAAVLKKLLPFSGVKQNEQLASEATAVTAEALLHAPVIAARENRLAALQDRHNRLAMVMDARAKDMADAPGGKSGLLARKIKMIGSGPFSEKVTEYQLDTGLLSEFREHEKQVAIEVGQWAEGNVMQTNIMVVVPVAAGYAPSQDAEPVTVDIGHTR